MSESMLGNEKRKTTQPHTVTVANNPTNSKTNARQSTAATANDQTRTGTHPARGGVVDDPLEVTGQAGGDGSMRLAAPAIDATAKINPQTVGESLAEHNNVRDAGEFGARAPRHKRVTLIGAVVAQRKGKIK